MKQCCSLFVVGVLAAGCASGGSKVSETAAVPAPQTLKMFGTGGAAIGWDELVSAAAAADVVIIGEVHRHPAGLLLTSTLFEEVLERSPDAMASLEFFERQHQAAIDDYLAGLSTEEQFKKATGRKTGNYPEGHRAMVEASKEAGQPVIASNAPAVYRRAASKEGFDRLGDLTEVQARLVAVPEAVTEGVYKDRFFKIMTDAFAAHGGGGDDGDEEKTEEEKEEAKQKQLDRIAGMFRAQNVWDETMADSVARGMDAGGKPVYHVVGQFHTDHDGGLLERLRGMKPDANILTISIAQSWDEALTTEDEGRASVVVYAGSDE